MSAPEGYPISFAHGFVLRSDLLFVSATVDEWEEEDVHHAIIFRWSNGVWNHWKVNHRVMGLAGWQSDDKTEVLAMSFDGILQHRDGDLRRQESISFEKEGPTNLRRLTTLRRIGDHIYATGMARQVYRRSLTDEAWIRVDEDVLSPRDKFEIVGFNDLAGRDEARICGVGYGGQIWVRENKAWQQVESPTSIRLDCVTESDSGVFFAAGAAGVILRGQGETWEIVDQHETTETFWSAEYAFGAVYLATSAGVIYRLSGDSLEPVDMGLGVVSTRSLHFADGRLLSIGEKDILSFDGSSWVSLGVP